VINIIDSRSADKSSADELFKRLESSAEGLSTARLVESAGAASTSRRRYWPSAII